MIVANWDYKITASKAVDAYKTATKYFEKYGSIGTALQNHIGRDTGLYTFFAGLIIMNILEKLMTKLVMIKTSKKKWNRILKLHHGKK